MPLVQSTVQFDAPLLQKYDQPVPRYTSYPPATELRANFDPIDFRAALAVSNYQTKPLSLYCHIPFCDSACYFCGCNTVITQHKPAAETYLDYLVRHLEQVAALVDGDRRVQQMHWGGGTPNFLTLAQIERLWTAIQDHFSFDADAEISIEVNPKALDQSYLNRLRSLGFNRLSFGIQDFNPKVQEAVNRVQPESMLFEVMDWSRAAGFSSINVDLIYGLPFQTLESYRHTIHKTLQLNPDRIAVFNFAYVPSLVPVQRHLPQSEMPSPSEKLAILQMTIEELTQAGYQYIGMDHFAKPNDELAIAQRQGQLHRNFQGYTTRPESDLLGFGMTSISMLNDVYVQNHKRLKSFYQAIDSHQLPIEKGVTLSQADIIRRTVIMELMCQFQIIPADIEEKYHLGFDLDFESYFSQAQPALQQLAADGLIQLSPNALKVTPVGRLLIRNIAAVFDTYLEKNRKPTFSRSI
ncbi:oxygen-independent coproporphyrinogen III oxidase [Lyngbya confervoides]|uniref:Coproporphyrinogen-III oxidase n=1 Tax=Lyngbya confervoides BDU141951 TaxID=1574623 RepID=A0ABD4T4J1_9CYAN|nr:oxygen-independent coproporphyrinogen III oxidase [Lyngbya confervoides]MCM1983642.1 oxygen-independent coproporphyrinogen III oxidase [Lyngbya confervoides BDU141951]